MTWKWVVLPRCGASDSDYETSESKNAIHIEGHDPCLIEGTRDDFLFKMSES